MFHNPQEAIRDFLLRCVPDELPPVTGETFAERTRSSMVVVLQGLEQTAENFIDFIDTFFSDDPDCEPCITDVPHDDEGEAEPTLGWSANGQCGSSTDGELEPSLGWCVNGALGASNLVWHGYDLEDEHDGREPDVDREPDHDNEPSLGWSSIGQQPGPSGIGVQRFFGRTS